LTRRRWTGACTARLVREVGDRVWNGGDIAFEEAVALLEDETADPYELLFHSNRLRALRFGRRVHLCSIVNAKLGGCAEDCIFCAQSANHRRRASLTGWLPVSEILETGRRAVARGSSCLGVVTAGRGIQDEQGGFAQALQILRSIVAEGRIEAHASFGLLGLEQLRELRATGVRMYNHNLETGHGFFPQICTTHTYEDRVRTIRLAREAGLDLCVGGIFGLGEAPVHRVQLAFALKELDVDSIPLNFLVPIQGTALEDRRPLRPVEMLRIIAVFRLVLPRKNILVCAGREHLADLASMIFLAGANGMMIGDLLPTQSRGVQDDLQLLSDLGLETEPSHPARASVGGSA
jgi:biotin synthase